VDRLAEKYTTFSTYNYCINNPIRIIDPAYPSLGMAAMPGARLLYLITSTPTGLNCYWGSSISDIANH